MRNEKMKAFDDETRLIHHHLSGEDDCYYFVEFVRGAGYGPPGNSFINNLKKKPSKRGTWEWQHKLRAISDAAYALKRELPKNWMAKSTFVPIPPSKATNHPEYDDRMTKVLEQLGEGVDVRELVSQKRSMDETHKLADRHSIDELAANYVIAENRVRPKPTHIVIVDDMMTAGAHFRAMYQVLEERFPDVPISGVFLARRVFPENNE
jgi:hypothetical protein